ncbi:hypothetical protein L7F22_057774 [Adiantum nelumboides]|nr:hypothetical protein [Adiantum nelumboides]
MVQHFDTLTVGMDASGRKKIFDELLQHPCFLTMQSKSKELKAIMLRNICNTLNHVKVPRSSNEFFVKKSAMLMLVNGGSKEQNTDMSIPQAAKLMGIHKRNLYSAKHHLIVSSESDGSFPASACHRDDAWRTHIAQTIKDIVFQFWTDETRMSPNKKDVCSKRLARCSYVKHPIHLLEEPQVELYLRFKTKYADIQILQRCFKSMKPFFVRKLRDRYNCCCIVHVQMIFLKEAINHMRTQSFDLHGSCCMCSCPICLHHDEVVNHGCLAYKNARNWGLVPICIAMATVCM